MLSNMSFIYDDEGRKIGAKPKVIDTPNMKWVGYPKSGYEEDEAPPREVQEDAAGGGGFGGGGFGDFDMGFGGGGFGGGGQPRRKQGGGGMGGILDDLNF